MKKFWIIAVMTLLLCGCGSEKPSPTESKIPEKNIVLTLAQTTETEKDGIRLRADVYENGLLRIRLLNRSGKVYFYGEGFGLYRRNNEGGWTHVPDSRSWTAIAYELEDGDDVELMCDLSVLPMEPGTYKMVRDGMELTFRLIATVKET